MIAAAQAWGRGLGLPVPLRRDAALALALAVLDPLMFFGVREGLGAALALSLLGHPALAWRTAAPLPVFAVMTAQSLVAALTFSAYRPTLGLLVALFTVAAARRATVAWGAALVAALVLAPSAVVQEVAQNPEDPMLSTGTFIVAAYLVLTGGATSLGRWAGGSRRQLTRLEQRRAREAAEAAEAITAERRRIARELHDILSHSVSVMVLQASGARAVMASDPSRTEDALANIESVGKESMVELRRLLGVLDEAPSGSAEPEFGRPPGVAELPAMVEGLRRSGLRVSLLEEGSRVRLDPSVDLSVYRIVQESLTNCIKHGGRDAVAHVQLAWADHLLLVEVVDDGGVAAATHASLSTEHGLPGLRERARAVGGHLEAGPDPSGGFRVSATLPVSSGEDSPSESPSPGGRP